MPQIPKKRVVTLTVTTTGGTVTVGIPGSQHYTGFMIQAIGIEPGFDIQASLDGTNWGRLSPENFFLAQKPHGVKDTVHSIHLSATAPGGLRLISADTNGTASLTTGGKFIVSMYDRAYPDSAY